MTIKLTTNTYQKFDELENMNVSYGFSHYERLKDYEAKLLDEQTIHRVCEQTAIQNFAHTIIVLKDTGVLKPRQINCLLATNFHCFDEALVLTEKQSQDFNHLNEELEHCADYSWCQEYKEKQELINFFLTEKKDDARKESLIISFLTDGKEVDDILKQEINNSHISSYDRQIVAHTIFKPKV